MSYPAPPYLYEHVDPINGLVFNVGISLTRKQRAFEMGEGRRNSDHVAYVTRLNKMGFEPIVRIVRDKMTELEAKAFEVEMIAIRKSEGHPLVNRTVGGDGLSGFKHSAETRAKMSATRMSKGALHHAKRPEVRSKISATLLSKGDAHSAKKKETRERMSAAQLALGDNAPSKRPMVRAKIGASMGFSRYGTTPEQRAARNDVIINLHAEGLSTYKISKIVKLSQPNVVIIINKLKNERTT